MRFCFDYAPQYHRQRDAALDQRSGTVLAYLHTCFPICNGKLDEQSDAFWQSTINHNLAVTMAQHGHSEVSI